MSDADETVPPAPQPTASHVGAEAATGADAVGAGLREQSFAAVLPSAAEIEALVASAVRRIAERAISAESSDGEVSRSALASGEAPTADERSLRVSVPSADEPGDGGNAEAPRTPEAPDAPDAVRGLSPPPIVLSETDAVAARPQESMAAADGVPHATRAVHVEPVQPVAASSLRTLFWTSQWTWRGVARIAGLVVASYFALVFALILLYRFVNPPTTTLIAYQWLAGTRIEQSWVPIEDISPNLLRAVVVSEDWGFCDHYGVDLVAIETALEQAGEGIVPRGASTISMQVIKNLFLSQSKSYLRKAVEIPLTFVAEAVWPKSRMLEIYLNIAEWGPGVFGAEAAARHHFSKPAAKLAEREAALLAAALPNPILRDAGDPGTRTARKASVIQSRMRAAGPVADCAMPPRKPANKGSAWQTTVKKRAGTAPGL